MYICRRKYAIFTLAIGTIQRSAYRNRIAARKNSKCLMKNQFGELQIIVGRVRNSTSRAGIETSSRNDSLHFNRPKFRQWKTRETKTATRNPCASSPVFKLLRDGGFLTDISLKPSTLRITSHGEMKTL